MSVPEFDPGAVGPDYLYVAVADYITARIEADDLPVGARLPAEHTMAEEYRVSLGTIRRATSLLRDRGLVATLPAKGSFVVGKPSTGER